MSVLSAAPLAVRDEPPVLRLLAVPTSEPPYDDDSGLHLLHEHPLAPLRRLGARRLTLVRPLSASTAGQEQDWTRTPATLLPDARAFAHALVQGLLEVQAGVRPLHQLQARTSAELFDRLGELLPARPPRASVRPRTGAVRSVRVQLSEQGVAEVCVRVQRGHRSTAVALRLEGRAGRWCCVEIMEL